MLPGGGEIPDIPCQPTRTAGLPVVSPRDTLMADYGDPRDSLVRRCVLRLSVSDICEALIKYQSADPSHPSNDQRGDVVDS